MLVRVAPDHERTGLDQDRVQIVVEGNLVINGTAENPVVFESFTDSLSTNSDWIGIEFESTASGNLANVVIRNATRAIENHTAITLTNCTITDCEVALDAYAGVTANGCVVAGNTDAYTAVDIQTGSPTFTNCTIVENAGSALAARSSSAPTLEKCVVSFNGGPAVRAISGWTGTATVQNSVLYDNDAASGSLTDAQWVTTGTNVHNLDPAFCDAANRDYHLYAFSPAAPGASSSERWGAFDVACAPDATVLGEPSSFPFASGDSRVIASCPHGDAPAAVVSVDLDDGIMTRDVAGGEFQLRLSDFSSKVFNDDSSMVAGGGATSGNGWTTAISHGYLGGSGVDMVDVLLNGWPLAEQARLDIRTPDFVAPFGLVNTGDFAYIGSNYQSPPKPYVAGCDLNGDGAVSTLDLSYFSQHVNHQSPYSQVNAPAGLMEATVEMVLGFTSEYITATHQRLYVDVDLENIGATTACVLMLRTGDATLELVEWQPAGGEIGDVLFTPTVRDGVPELFIGVLVDGSFAGSNERLGRLVFDVFQSDPIEITEDHFVLSYGEVLVDNPGGTAMAATMTGSVGRQLDTEIARVYHDRLEQNFPNPFNPTTTLAFSIKAGAHVTLTIYDVAGRRVRDLVDEQRAPGAYRVVWDGRNENGAPVSTGVYFYKLVAGAFTATRKMTLLK
ncbi:MAG: right-handed parallel beta-helix repeat-containing protein [Candidatus Krumholzibacteria bacterium]|nr:right-handed parallel beta-helix repeat-containing protein [Candidatus Krumholzibacteria bacterium]MDH4337568.1 right-handed parallel beta-helix repeat-containing protein [Candidatus Krumholzibacteria bacterium]